MKTLFILFKTELTLAVREFSGVLFGVVIPVGLMLLLGVIYGDKPAYDGAEFTLLQQALPAVMSIGICASGLMGLPLTIASYREKKILKRFQVTPTSPLLLLGAQFLSNLVFTVLSSLLVYLTAVLFFGYTMRGSLLSFIESYFLVLAGIYSMGMLIASLSGTIKTANLLCSLAYFPMLFLSGATIPFEIMPRGMQAVSRVLPLSQGIMLMKGVSLNSAGFSPLKPAIIVGATGLVCLVLSLKTFRWE